MTADPKILIGVGMAPEQAKRVGQAVVTGISAAGSAIADATKLGGKCNVVSTAAASTGVQLPEVALGEVVVVQNRGANTVAVYPSSASQKINGGSDGASVNVAATKTGVFQRVSGTDTLFYVSA